MPRIFSIRVIFYLIVLLALDMTISPVVCLGGIRFYLTYLMILYTALQWGWQKTIPMAVLVGILRDLVSSQALGIETCALFFASLLLDLMVQKMERELAMLRFMEGFVFVFCALVLNLILSSFLSDIPQISWYYLMVSIGSAVYTAAMMPIFFYLTSRWFHDRIAIKQYELFR